MTVIELGTFMVLAVVTSFGVWRLMRHQRRRELEAGRDPRSGTFASAAASTLLAMKVDPLVDAGSTIYLPVGDGLYMQRANLVKANAWKRVLKDWMRRGATLNILVTLPNDAARKAWRPFEKEFPYQFHYYELDRSTAPAELATEIARLDTYHPVLVVNPDGETAPGAMWIEQYHPLGSAYAYAVQYVAPPEARTDTRFQTFLSVYRKLIESTRVQAGSRELADAA